MIKKIIKNIIFLLGILGINILILVFIIYVLSILFFKSLDNYTNHNVYIKMPNLLELTFDDAIKKLKNMGVRYHIYENDIYKTNITNTNDYIIVYFFPKNVEYIKPDRIIYIYIKKINK
ncbi:MAG: hypothetical protein NHF98_01240 [Candidatus Bostrichicola ureolyticus]|nr:MAG: hypothetical protein NHF98_01240 [Candidatus Bostrichicola ureolyticus]